MCSWQSAPAGKVRAAKHSVVDDDDADADDDDFSNDHGGNYGDNDVSMSADIQFISSNRMY